MLSLALSGMWEVSLQKEGGAWMKYFISYSSSDVEYNYYI